MTHKQTDNPASGESEMTFNGLGIAPSLLDVLLRLGFKTPTSIQHKAIPVAVEGKDIIGIAQTGTGKTLTLTRRILFLVQDQNVQPSQILVVGQFEIHRH